MIAPLMQPGAARPLIASTAVTRTFNAETSPDGRWIAYQSDESGRPEIYVHPFPALDRGRWQASFSGGTYPAWSRSGRELFFINGTGELVSVPVSTGPSFVPRNAAVLFAAGHYHVDAARNYDVTTDAKRFLFVKNLTSASRPSMVVVSNWAEEIHAKMETR